VQQEGGRTPGGNRSTVNVSGIRSKGAQKRLTCPEEEKPDHAAAHQAKSRGGAQEQTRASLLRDSCNNLLQGHPIDRTMLLDVERP